MILNHVLLLLTGIPSIGALPDPPVFYENYHRALQAAKESRKPMLVILNPGPQWEGNAATIDQIRKTRQRRELLDDYVVVIIDTTSPHGQIVHRAYRKPKLPHVVVLGKRQTYQIFTTSKQLYGQRWTEILQKHRKGERIQVVTRRPAAFCPT